MSMDGRKLIIWTSVAITVFVAGVAIWLKNPGLFILSGLAAATALTAWTRTPR